MQYTTHRLDLEANDIMKTSFLPRPSRVIKPAPETDSNTNTNTQVRSDVKSSVGVDWAIDTGPVEDFIPQYRPFPQAQDPMSKKRTK